MITTACTRDDFREKLCEHIRHEIDRIAEEESKAAAVNVERRVRAKVAGIAAQIVENISFSHFGTDLVITIRFPKDESRDPPVDHS